MPKCFHSFMTWSVRPRKSRMARVSSDDVVSAIVWAGSGRKCWRMPVVAAAEVVVVEERLGRWTLPTGPMAETEADRTALCPRTKLMPAWMTTPSSRADSGAGGGVDRRFCCWWDEWDEDRLAETDCERDSL